MNQNRNKVKWYPRLFTGDMVRELLSGRKTATRWPLRKQPVEDVAKRKGEWVWEDVDGNIFRASVRPGDIIWVREKWRIQEIFEHECIVRYRADSADLKIACDKKSLHIDKNTMPTDWRHPILMPLHFSRIFLEVLTVRCIRLQDISEKEACDEGMMPTPEALKAFPVLNFSSAIYNFITEWDNIYTEREFEWDANPWVWVVTFRRIKKEDALNG